MRTREWSLVLDPQVRDHRTNPDLHKHPSGPEAPRTTQDHYRKAPMNPGTLPASRRTWGWDNPIAKALRPDHYDDPTNDGLGVPLRWADHQDVIESAGGTVYIAHPYILDGLALDDLARLRDMGWQVRVSGSDYQPGRSVRVSIEKGGRDA